MSAPIGTKELRRIDEAAEEIQDLHHSAEIANAHGELKFVLGRLWRDAYEQGAAAERDRCAAVIRAEAKRVLDHGVTLVAAGNERDGLPKVSRGAAMDSAAKLLEQP